MSLRFGDSSAQVADLKFDLLAVGYFDGEVNINFDSDLLDAVVRYQTDKGLAVDGIVGKKTRAALDQDLCDINSGAALKRAQQEMDEANANAEKPMVEVTFKLTFDEAVNLLDQIRHQVPIG